MAAARHSPSNRRGAVRSGVLSPTIDNGRHAGPSAAVPASGDAADRPPLRVRRTASTAGPPAPQAIRAAGGRQRGARPGTGAARGGPGRSRRARLRASRDRPRPAVLR